MLIFAAEGSLLFLTMCYSAFEFPANSFIYWSVSRFFRVCRQFDVILWRCSKEFTLDHYHTLGVYDSKSTTAEYFVQRSANDVPRMAFKKCFHLRNSALCSTINTRSGAKQRHFLCIKYWPYHIQVLWEREILLRYVNLLDFFFPFKLSSWVISPCYVACVAGGIRGHERMGSLKYRLPKNDTFWVPPTAWSRPS
jgi:hypothetical protein